MRHMEEVFIVVSPVSSDCAPPLARFSLSVRRQEPLGAKRRASGATILTSYGVAP
jgi:hypothetical protein